MFAIVSKNDPERWLMSHPGGRLDHWGPIVSRAEFTTLETARLMRRVEGAEKNSHIVRITSDKCLRQYEVVD